MRRVIQIFTDYDMFEPGACPVELAQHGIDCRCPVNIQRGNIDFESEIDVVTPPE
jgi:hypothetical protein